MSTDAIRIGSLAQECIDNKTKPPGSLGDLEVLAVQLSLIKQSVKPVVDPFRILVFAADHGIANEGVSAFPREVTAQMMHNFASGGAAVCVLSATSGAQLEVVDVGVAADLSMLPNVVPNKIAEGTMSFANGPAMTISQCEQAMTVGAMRIRQAVDDGVECIGLGEMGIGNTTSASVLLGVLINASAEEVTGRGTGVDDARLKHKRKIVSDALQSCRQLSNEPGDLLAAVGGFEIAAIVGAMVEAGKHPLPILVDGFIVTVAALLACRMDENLRERMVFAHASAESGHQLALQALSAKPLLQLDMRLGEGSATAIAFPLLRSAAAIMRDMASFADAGVSTADDTAAT